MIEGGVKALNTAKKHLKNLNEMKNIFEQKVGIAVSEVRFDRAERVRNPNGCDVFFTFLSGSCRDQQGHVWLPCEKEDVLKIFEKK